MAYKLIFIIGMDELHDIESPDLFSDDGNSFIVNNIKFLILRLCIISLL